jgi:hypothetical protein
MNTKLNKYDHSSAIKKIAEEFSLNPKDVQKIVSMFFGGHGLKRILLKNEFYVHKFCKIKLDANGRRNLKKKMRKTRKSHLKRYQRYNQKRKMKREYYFSRNLYKIYQDI